MSTCAIADGTRLRLIAELKSNLESFEACNLTSEGHDRYPLVSQK